MIQSRLQSVGNQEARARRIGPIVLGLVTCLVWASVGFGSSTEQTASLTARSVILMIGDGMGAEHVKAARWFAVGASGLLAMDQLSVQDGWARTADVNGSITDSAAAATAMATGFKTQNTRLSVSVADERLTTILERAKANGKAVGLITTVSLTHATSAAFAAHTDSRYTNMSIAEQLIEAGVDVLMGGGSHDFLPYRVRCDCGWSGWRMDGRDLLAEAQEAGYAFVCNSDGLLGIDVGTVERLLGLFAEEEMLEPFSPTLDDMMDVALQVLSQDPDGFFLMVEGGQIDWESHDNTSDKTISRTLGFDRAVAVGVDYVREVGDTLLIVTSDHETGGMSVTEEPSGTHREDGPFEAPGGSLFYLSWAGTDHTGVDVPVRAEGPFAELLSGSYENTHIFDVMVMALGLEPRADSEENEERAD